MVVHRSLPQDVKDKVTHLTADLWKAERAGPMPGPVGEPALMLGAGGAGRDLGSDLGQLDRRAIASLAGPVSRWGHEGARRASSSRVSAKQSPGLFGRPSCPVAGPVGGRCPAAR